MFQTDCTHLNFVDKSVQVQKQLSTSHIRYKIVRKFDWMCCVTVSTPPRILEEYGMETFDLYTLFLELQAYIVALFFFILIAAKIY